ncbi:MAG: hypothetical protein QXN37_04350 [Candidatus Anstonellaceae archaeon]
MALVLLSFMLITSQIWVNTLAQNDAHISSKFKGQAIRTALASLSDRGLSEFAEAAAFFATFKLVNATQINGLPDDPSADPRNPGTGRVEKIAYELMINGTSSMINYTEEEKQAYTLKGWQEKVQQAAGVLGLNASFGQVENFRFFQKDAWSIGVSFELEMNLTDAENTMKQSKKLKANASFSIEGFVDPLVVREELNRRGGIVRDPSLVAQKQIWKNPPYEFPEDVAPVLIDNAALEGTGWFFGPITSDFPNTGIFSGDEIYKIKQYILVRPYSENVTIYANMYGAVILTTAPTVVSRNYIDSQGCNVTEYNQTNCLNCLRWVEVNDRGPGCTPVAPYIYTNEINVPFVVASAEWSSNRSKIPTVRREGLQDQTFVLIDNEIDDKERKRQGYHRIWDITKLRDMAICGFYIRGEGPSFFQRMLAAGINYRNSVLGIESFLVGTWAGGKDDMNSDDRSRLDWEFYSSVSPQIFKIKGMMGCKDRNMCSTDSAVREGVGHFRLSKNASDRYILQNIACGYPGIPSARCD